jgi:membrane dipeptidase
MNRLGLLVDLSHVGRRTTLEAIEASAAPCSFTHASAAHFVDVPRTKSDEVIRALGARGGVVGIIGLSPYLRDRGSSGSTIGDLVDHIVHVGSLIGLDKVGLGLDIIEGLTRDAWETRMLPAFQALPGISTQDPFEFDTYYPEGLRSMRDMRTVTEHLIARGLSDDEVRGVLGENFLRLFETVWAGVSGQASA